ncbi:MAG: hypothetical protein ABW215_20255 [Kibdelosporangium sp.]
MLTLPETTRHADDLVRQAIAELSGAPAAEHQLRDPAQEGFAARLDTLYARWTANEFPLSEDACAQGRHLWVERNADAFRMAVRANDNEGSPLTATSPCVWSE